ncbi:MAG: 5'-nucleotidase C-terminal domain-containing protein [Mangrovibacterium sp.]
MRKALLSIIVLLAISSCKSNLVVSDFKARSLGNDQSQQTTDSSLVKFIQPYKEQLDEVMGETIIMSDAEMVRKLPESEMTNCVADMFLENCRQMGAQLDGNPYPDIAYINFFSLRANLPKGKVSLGKLYEIFPFENQIVYILVSGENMMKFAQITAHRGGDCVSGMRMTITKDGNVGAFEINGQSVDKNKYYWIVTSDYIANGGDNMTMFANPKKRIDSGFKVRDSFIDYMRSEHAAGRTLSGKLDGRISNEQ